MKYENRTFTLPVASNRVTQEEWDRIFNSNPIECHDLQCRGKRCGGIFLPRAEGRKRTRKSAGNALTSRQGESYEVPGIDPPLVELSDLGLAGHSVPRRRSRA